MKLQNLNLASKEFQADAAQTFRDLLSDKCFTDVTLVCDDDEQISLHKVVLSSSSPFFKNILLKNPHPNPLLYIKGVTHAQLHSIVNFVYLGQTEVAQEDLDTFLATARELKIKGLCDENQSNIDLVERGQILEDYRNPLISEIKHRFVDDEPSGRITNHTELLKEETLENYTTYPSDQSIVVEKITTVDVRRFICDQCDKFFTRNSHLKRHKKEIHDGGVKYYCDQCDKLFTQNGHLKRHKNEVHETRSLRYKCSFCEFETKRSEYLKVHKEMHSFKL